MEKRKSLDGVVKNSAEKKNKISPRLKFFSGFNLGISFVLFAVLLLGFWFTFRAVAMNAPTGNPPTGTGNVISVNDLGTIVLIGGGTGKLNVGTIDPVFDISGVKYATYVSGMIGQKEEISGVVKLQKSISSPEASVTAAAYKYVIDFDEQAVGSDFWLFRKITDFSANERLPAGRQGSATSDVAGTFDGAASGGKQDWDGLSVLLTPEFSGRVWYEKRPAENQLIFYALPTINYPITELPSYEVSYRLTSSRFDWRQWPNLLEDQSLSGFKIE